MKDVVDSDVLILGAGIAGASLAYFLAPHVRVVVLEREPHPGTQATARSAALYVASYGSPQARRLTRASRRFFDAPPPGFAAQRLLTPRGALTVGGPAQADTVLAQWEMPRPLARMATLLNGEAVRRLVPILRPEAAACGYLEPDASDIDVNELLHGFLRGARRAGAQLHLCSAPRAIEHARGRWCLHGEDRTWRAPVLVNAAGAWVDEVAAMAGVAPLGVQALRRSAFVFKPPQGTATHAWPMVMDVDEGWYFKPDAGLLLGSCANADPVPAQDVQPEELDIALGIHRLEAATTLTIRRPERTWAGLRTFAPSGDLVGGFDTRAEGFFWLAGQGGCGIQTSPAMGEACARIIMGRPLPEHIVEHGLSAAHLAVRALS